MQRYIGLDAHTRSCTFAVVGESGRRLNSAVVETNGKALVSFIKTVPGRKHVCLEEGTQSTWLSEILSPHCEQVVVTHLERPSRGRKDDETDAFARAEELRIGAVKPVFKDDGRMSELRAHVDVQEQITWATVRAQNRLKALYRSRGVSTTGRQIYSAIHRDEYVAKLPRSHRAAALLLHAQYEAMRDVKKDADKQVIEASRKHAIATTLETCPGMGPIRVAQFIATVISPYRFRSSRQLWSYCGMGVVMRSSSDWMQGPGGWQRVERNKTRGLNRNFNRRMKHVFKGAATGVLSHHVEPMYGDYVKLTQQGTKPPLAKLTLARRIAATVLAMWKNQEVYDPDKYRPQQD